MKKRNFIILSSVLLAGALSFIHYPYLRESLSAEKQMSQGMQPFMHSGEHYVYIIGGAKQSDINKQLYPSLPPLMNFSKTPVFIASHDTDLRNIAEKSALRTKIKVIKSDIDNQEKDFINQVTIKSNGRPKLMVFESDKNISLTGSSQKGEEVSLKEIYLKGNSILSGMIASSPDLLYEKVERALDLKNLKKEKPNIKIYLFWNGINYTNLKST